MRVLVIRALVLVRVIFDVSAMRVYVGVDMCMLVSMENVTVTVLVRVYVRMLVRVLQRDSILYHNDSAYYHYRKRNEKLH